MNILKTKIQGVVLLELDLFPDERGVFLETYQIERYKNLGLKDDFVQDNHSRSYKNVLRGMHYQKKSPQSQILTVMSGSIFDVVVDLRTGSDTFKEWFGIELTGESNRRQIYMPPGIAHGFCVLSDIVDLHYKVSQNYNSKDEGGLLWSDPIINIKWPIKSPIVSERDQLFPCFNDLSFNDFPNSK